MSCERFTSSSSRCCSQFIHTGALGKSEKTWLKNMFVSIIYALKEWDEGEVRDKDKWRWMSEIYIISGVNPSNVCPQIEDRRINKERLQNLPFFSPFLPHQKRNIASTVKNRQIIKRWNIRETIGFKGSANARHIKTSPHHRNCKMTG